MSLVGRPLVGLLAILLAGSSIDVVFRLLPRRLLARWPLRAVFGLAALYVAAALPWFGVGLALVGAVLRVHAHRRAGPQVHLPGPPRTGAPSGARAPRIDRGAVRLAAAIVAAIAVVVSWRTWLPLYWDEFVWLAKARIEADHPFGLVGEVLHANTSAIPVGYPPLEPLSVAALAGWSSDRTTLVAGTVLLQIVIASSFVLLAVDRTRPDERRSLALGMALGTAPLVLLHLRSAYVDLETGLLAGTLLLLLELGLGQAAALVAIVLVGMKDEGTVHLVAVTSAVVFLSLLRRKPSSARNAFAAAVTGLVPFALWHERLARAGIVRTDHALGGLAYGRLPTLGRMAFAHAIELLSWGPLWAVVVGMIVAAALRPRAFGRSAQLRLFVVVAQVVVFAFGLLATNGRVMEFAQGGTLVGRLLVELAPVVMLAVTAAT